MPACALISDKAGLESGTCITLVSLHNALGGLRARQQQVGLVAGDLHAWRALQRNDGSKRGLAGENQSDDEVGAIHSLSEMKHVALKQTSAMCCCPCEASRHSRLRIPLRFAVVRS